MKISDILPYLILIVTFPTIAQYLNISIKDITIIWWVLYGLIIWVFLKGKRYFYRERSLPFFIKVFIYFVLVEGFYGIFMAQGYWDYKTLISNLFIYLLPLCIYVFSSPRILSKTLNKWFRYALIAFFLFLPIMQAEAPGKYLIPVMFMLLFIKPLQVKSKVIILVFFVFIFVFGSLGARASVLKYSVSLLMGVSLYTNVYNSKIFLRALHLTMMFTPFVFLILGLLGIFNVFKFDEYFTGLSGVEVKSAYNEESTEKLDADTRTLLYTDVISSAINNNYMWQGHSLARGYESGLFGHEDLYGRGERYDTEVSSLNIFTHFGIFGILIYFGIFYTASYSAIRKSNNKYMRMLGIFVAFRWIFSWIEDFSLFDLNYLFLWIIIGMCFSTSFRGMRNFEFELWIRSIMGRRKLVK